MQNKSSNRRDFIKKAGLLTATLAVVQLPVWGKSKCVPDYPLHNIPED